jgi:uncharacterized protein YndB with AHSA1/START domain
MSSKNEVGTRAKTIIERTYRARIEDVWALWTTKEGFESWWGPEGFRVEVHAIEPRVGGTLRYDMIADSPETVAALKELGRPPSHATHSRFSELKFGERLVLTSVIDFFPGVEAYEADIAVDFSVAGDTVRMVVTLDAMHSDEFTNMQKEGFTSQLTKLDKRFG